MAKAEKKEFAWDSEQHIGDVEISDREFRKVSMCELGEKTFISITTFKYFKKKGTDEEQWNPIKGATVPLDAWFTITTMIGDFIDEMEE